MTAVRNISPAFRDVARAQAAAHLARTNAIQEEAALQAQQEAENALAMALHYVRSGATNVQGATRKAVQALAALNELRDLLPAGAGVRMQAGRA